MKLGKTFFYSALVVASVGSAYAGPWPVGIYDEATALNKKATVIPVIANDTGDNLFVSSVNASSKRWGKVSINEDKKSVTYTSYSAGEDEFWYVLEDDQGRKNAARVTIKVVSNAWPKASSDTAKAAYNEIITIAVLDNDTGTGLTLKSANKWSADYGKVWIEGDQIKYQQVGEPRGDITDEFWYVFEDQWKRTNAGKVTVSVSNNPTTPWPKANVDTAEAKNGLVAMIPVLANDRGDGLTITETNSWTHNGGKTDIVEDLIRYTPPKNFTGTDHFWYDFEDKFGRTNSAKVTVEVTQNTALSIVEFCGVNYETDGTAGNTVETNQEPTEAIPQYLAIGGVDFVEQGGVIGNRRYYIKGTQEAGLSLWVEIDGSQTKLVDAEAGEALSLVGAYNKHAYYSKGLNLFAHDGQKVTDLGYLFGGIDGDIGTQQYPIEYSIVGLAANNALYIKAITSNANVMTYTTKEWRLSNGLDLTMVWIDKKANVYNDLVSVGSTVLNVTDETQLTYFSGFEYSKQWRRNYWNSDSYDKSLVVADRNEELKRVIIDSDVWDNTNIVENNNRLFIVQGNNETGGKLYAIDPFDRSFDELASCAAN